MPTYEYECGKCDHTFEVFQSMTDKPIRVCPECKGRKVRRLIGTGAAIIFKGSGFYQTDYRSNAYNEAKKKDTESAKGSSGEAKSESKSESKSPPKESKAKSADGTKD